MSMSNEIVENVRVYIVVSGTLPLFASLDPAAAHQFNDNVQDAYSSLRLVTVDLIPPVVPVKDPAQTVVPMKDPTQDPDAHLEAPIDVLQEEARALYHDTYLAILERGGGYQDAAHAAELARDTYLKTFNVNNI